MPPLLASIEIGDSGGGNRRRIPAVGGLRMSWELNRAGLLSCQVPIADIRNIQRTTDLIGRELFYTHPTAGEWAGIITASAPVSGVLDIAAETFHVLARKRFVTLANFPANGGDIIKDRTGKPGALFKAVLTEQNKINGYPLSLRVGAPFDTNSGSQTSVQFVDEDLYDSVIPALTEDEGYEWGVHPDRKVWFRAEKAMPQYGSGVARLLEGAGIGNVARSRWVDDLWLIDNVVRGTGDVEFTKRVQGKKVTTYVRRVANVYDKQSVARYGPLMELIEKRSRSQNAQSLKAFAQQQLKRNRTRAGVELDVVDVDGVWRRFREGDWVAVELGLTGITGMVRVMVRSLDVQAGIMSIAGEGVRVGSSN